MNELQELEKNDTLNDTFNLFFAPTEETVGTGEVVRSINGTLTPVVVDDDEYTAFHAEERAKADRRNEELAARREAERLYDDR